MDSQTCTPAAMTFGGFVLQVLATLAGIGLFSLIREATERRGK